MKDEFEPGVAREMAPGLHRLVAPNPGMMTGPGTNTYLIGRREIAVVDPGPALAPHVESILASAGAPIRWIVVTHTHPDHSPAARLLAAETGAALIGRAAPEGAHQDRSFVPDLEPADGERIEIGEFELRALHTPGHASNHVCYLVGDGGLLLTGDHIMSGSTVVIDPPDGSMARYLESLARLRAEPATAILPGHGGLIADPVATIDWIVSHRLEREAKVVDCLARHPQATPAELVLTVYDDVDRRLHRVAERSLLAHLLKLEEEGRAVRQRERWRPA